MSYFYYFRNRKKTILLGVVVFTGVLATFSLYWFENAKKANALATSNGDGLILYGQSGNTTPRWRTYTATSNTFSPPSPSVLGGVGNTFRLVTSPIKQEAIAGYVDGSANLRVLCYDGTTWVNEWSVPLVVNTGSQRRFDVAYETTSGDAMVVYSTNAAPTDELAYRTKLGSTSCGAASWSGATSLNPLRTSSVVHWVRLEGSPVASSNTIALAWGDANGDLSAMEWTGAGWTVAEPLAALELNLEVVSANLDVQSFDIAFESVSGNLMVAWGVLDNPTACTVGSNCIRYARYTTSWSTPAAMPTVADSGTSINLASNPNTNEIALGAIDNGPAAANTNDLSAAYWSGSAWTGTANLDTTTASPVAGGNLVAAGWLITGGTSRSVIVYDDASATNLSWAVGSGGTFTLQTDFTPAPLFGSPHRWYDIQTDPVQKDRLMFTIADINADLFAKRLVMSAVPAFTWTNADGGAALETTLAQTTAGDFSFAYWRFIPVPNAPPAVPTLSEIPAFPNWETPDTTPLLGNFASTDPEGNAIEYEIQWDEDFNFGSPVSKTSSGFPGDGGWTAAMFPSGAAISYTIQAGDALTNGQVYWWRVRARDPAGSNSWSAYSLRRSLSIDISISVDRWHQTTGDQFNTGTLTNVEVTSGEVKVQGW